MSPIDRNARAGVMLGLSAYALWGFLPLFFKLLAGLGAGEIVAHRVLWSLVFLALVLTISRRWQPLMAGLRSPRVIRLLLLSAGLIAVNWLVYIWAVLNGHVLAGSLGYYLNPLVNVLLGVAFLKERLSAAQKVAVALAAAGVAFLALRVGGGLWISLVLAGSFALYGFVRKIAPVESLEGLSIETALLAPLALAWLFWLGSQGTAGFPADTLTNILAILSGAVTAIPLLLFAAAARRLPYSTLGMLQYIAPTIQFLLAVFLFGEALTPAHIVCFAAIWTALSIFAIDGIRAARAARGGKSAEGVAASACAEPCSVP